MAVRKFFYARKFHEVILSPLDNFETRYPGSLRINDYGSLRFNTEPEIWDERNTLERFFSVTPLFRREREPSVWQRPAFHIVDFYLNGDKNHVFETFFALLKSLGRRGCLKRLPNLRHAESTFDALNDTPKAIPSDPALVIVDGYGPQESFFEIDAEGRSTRSEIFVAFRGKAYELAALGRVGENKNSSYHINRRLSYIPRHLCGMGIGLERLLLADRLLRTEGTG
jgi:hypothetical protein